MGYVIVVIGVLLVVGLCLKELLGNGKGGDSGCSSNSSCGGSCTGCSADTEIIVTVKRPKEDKKND
ncbi:MAG: hypothetical protein K5656_10645 [Lachnospiraceae bacterium]|nr:hypothetical protein [Lachnospiraceae bacterium]